MTATLIEEKNQPCSLEDKISSLDDLVDKALELLVGPTPDKGPTTYQGIISFLIERLDMMIGKMTVVNEELMKISQSNLGKEIRKP